jgi:hypothetical protein
LNKLYLAGTWDFQPEFARNQSSDARILYKYESGHVYFVASSETGVRITVLRDSAPVAGEFRGEDLDDQGHAFIKEARLYKLITEKDMNPHTIEIIVDSPGLDAYTFTFG